MDENNTTRLPARETQQGRHSKEERGPELYPTPASATIALLNAEPLPQRLWEPAAGMGHMASVLKRRGHVVLATDLYDYGQSIEGSPYILPGIDFLKCDNQSILRAAGDVGAIVTNPPFSHAEQFVRIGIKLAPKVCILARLAFLESDKRTDILDNYLVRVYPFVNRLPMMHRWVPGPDGRYIEWPGKKSSSAVPYAWFVFEADRPFHQEPTLRRIRCSLKS